MGQIVLDRITHDRISLLAHAWNVSESETVSRLLDRFVQESQQEREASEGVAIHVVYKGERINAEYDPETEAVTILNGSLAGKRFKKPSGAAVAVVRSIDPSVSANRNGWSFWTVTASGHDLQSLRR